MTKRWNGIGRTVGMTSAAVAGVCLSSSVASAWTNSRDQDFETEFDVDSGPAATVEAKADAVTAEVAPAAEQTVGGYLDRLVRRADDVDVVPECLPEKQPAADAARDEDGDGDLDGDGEKVAAAADADDVAWQAFMVALIGPPFEETRDATEVDADREVSSEKGVAAADADDVAWQALMATLIGPPFEETRDATDAQAAAATESATDFETESDFEADLETDLESAPAATESAPAATESEPAATEAEPVASVSAAEQCCPAEDAATRNLVAAVRPVLEFVPFRWLDVNPTEITAKSTLPPATLPRQDAARLSFFP